MSDESKFSQNNGLHDAHLTDDQQHEVSSLHWKERRNVSLVLLIVVFFGVQDFIEDLATEGGLLALVTDLVYVSLMIGLLLYIWRHVPRARSRQSRFLSEAVVRKHEDAEAWREQAAELLEGLGRMIDRQLSAWQLSQAEREVAVMLLKGFSLRDIAALRGTGERTVRQQAARIYTKSSLSGRAELSAFFLEDLLPPTTTDSNNNREPQRA